MLAKPPSPIPHADLVAAIADRHCWNTPLLSCLKEVVDASLTLAGIDTTDVVVDTMFIETGSFRREQNGWFKSVEE